MENQKRSSLQNLSISYEFALAIGNSLNLSEMLHEVIYKMVHKTNAHRGIIWVKNGEKKFQPVASAGINIEDVPACGEIMDLRDVLNQIQKREQFVLRYKDDKDFLQYCPLLTEKEESVLIVPVTNVAIIYLVYAGREMADEPLANLLTGLSKKLSVAIEACMAHKNIINEVQVRVEAEKELKTKTEQLSSGEKDLQRLYGESEQARKSLLSILEDVAQKEEALRKSEEKYRLLADNSIDVIWQMDLKLVFTYVSPSIKNVMGYAVEEWVGTRLSQYSSTKEFFNMARKALHGVKNYKKIKNVTFETKMLQNNGNEIPVEISSKLLFNNKGLPIGLQGSTRDITERKLAELELAKHHEQVEELVIERTGEVERSQKSLVLLLEDVNEVNQELKNVNNTLDATNKELEAFSYSVSHDLRAPLTRMDGFSKALINSYSNKLDEQGIHFLNRISVSSQHMARLIDDLLSLSRITREKVTRQKVDMSQTAVNIANELEASEPGREVNIEIAKGLNANADRKFVVIILENLLGNAYKFTGKKKNATIEFGEKIIDENKVFFIKDNGAGFNMKYYDKIFSAFQRLHSDEEYKGTGIGLAIVQRIINKHGGKIWAESEEGKGATFYFRF